MHNGKRPCCPACGQDLPYPSWRAELLDRVPNIVARGGIGASWWRAQYVEEFGREPIVKLHVISGGKS